MMRPKVRPGNRRIEWKCDCGADLYADFCVAEGGDIDSLEHSLQNPGSAATEEAKHRAEDERLECGRTNVPNEEQNQNKHLTTAPHGGDSSTNVTADETKGLPTVKEAQQPTPRPAFLALCVNTGDIYKTLAEISTEKIASDAEVFSLMRNEYLRTRGLQSNLKLMKPVTVEFVQFTLWNLRHGYVSVCDRPNAIPSDDVSNYQYLPRPLKPLPPMPPEIFIHYLEHGEDDLSPARHDWLPRLPKRLDKRVVDSDETCLGWGLHIIEGPNRKLISLVMVTMFTSFLSAVLWSALKNDIQGGTGVGVAATRCTRSESHLPPVS
ncbi:hypothetical protein G7Z17_g3807 [Cylindrodendrum hubeiense]|uniref:Uncharacterized protein n=1 Tax=Cylindrodendrum hubeiense TaxID=595255 RepID=A0A9P5LD81_9HYPO|nr:hypothetical protein G7Z17_g3807 [Cylindrodendrum hubeiense]